MGGGAGGGRLERGSLGLNEVEGLLFQGHLGQRRSLFNGGAGASTASTTNTLPHTATLSTLFHQNDARTPMSTLVGTQHNAGKVTHTL